jgi:hypothetical protein
MKDNRRETGIDSLNTEDISLEEFKNRMNEIFIEIQKKHKDQD